MIGKCFSQPGAVPEARASGRDQGKSRPRGPDSEPPLRAVSRVARFELHHFGKPCRGILKIPHLLMRAAELKAYGIHRAVDCFCLLQRLERLLRFSEAQQGAAADEVRRSRVLVRLQGFLRVIERFLRLVRAQVRVGQIQMGVWMSGPQFERTFKRRRGLVGLPLVVIVFSSIG